MSDWLPASEVDKYSTGLLDRILCAESRTQAKKFIPSKFTGSDAKRLLVVARRLSYLRNRIDEGKGNSYVQEEESALTWILETVLEG